MPELKFYDVKGKESFMSDEFRLVSKETKKGTSYFAIAKAPSGIEAWRIVSKGFFMENQ